MGGGLGRGESGEELGRGEVAEGLVGALVVVGVFPFSEGVVDGADLEAALVELVELLGVGALGAFDGAIEFRAARRQDEEPDVSLPASLFEGGGELAAAVDLDCPDREGHTLLELVQEGGGGY
jgi:hypothetical protein